MPKRERTERRPSKNPIQVRFIAGFGPIGREPTADRATYLGALGLPMEDAGEGYLWTDRLEGAKHFAIWPIAQAARSCFGSERWPKELPVPQAWLEFEVEDLPRATEELGARGFRLLVRARTEPWGQTVTRFLGPEGILLAVTHTPSLRSTT